VFLQMHVVIAIQQRGGGFGGDGHRHARGHRQQGHRNGKQNREKCPRPTHQTPFSYQQYAIVGMVDV
jgi:hypothetical protein